MTASNRTQGRTTHQVDPELFQQVYDSPASLPGKESWVTRDEDVREIEKPLGMDPLTIWAPRAIAELACHGCGTAITDLRSFKCHNWAYAVGELRDVIRRMDTGGTKGGSP